LQEVIASPDGDDFVRGEVLEAMAYLSAQGAISEEAMRAF
jgi:hypothetical protein